MCFYELAAQYEETAVQIQKRIAELKKDAKLASRAEAFSLQKRIEALYAELHDLRVVAKYLNDYQANVSKTSY